MTTDRINELAREALPCDCEGYGDAHALTCAGHWRSTVRAAMLKLRREVIEECAAIAERWDKWRVFGEGIDLRDAKCVTMQIRELLVPKP